MLMGSGTIERRCPRRWSVLAPIAMFSTAIVLGGVQLSTAAAEKDATTKAPATSKEKADSKEKVTPEQRRAQLEEKLKKLDLNSPEYQEAMKEFEKLMEAEKAKLPPMNINPPPPFQPVDPADIDRLVQEQQQMMRQQMERMMQMMRQNGALRGLPAQGLMLNPFVRSNGGDGRFGIRIERPGAALAEQLDLPADTGMVIAEVRPDSPAARAGLKPHDILLEMGGKPVPNDAIQFVQMVRNMKADDAFDVTVVRKGKKETIKGIKLPEQKAEAAPQFGLDGLPDARLFDPVPMPGPRGANDPRQRLQPFGFNRNGLGNSSSTSVHINNGEFTIRSHQNGVTYVVTGRKEGDENKINEIQVKDGDTDVKATNLEKVPEKYRDQVKKLLETVK